MDSVLELLREFRDARLIEQALFMNYIWDWATERGRQQGHPYYAVMASELRAIVRSYGR